jgi:hypothetical protein
MGTASGPGCQSTEQFAGLTVVVTNTFSALPVISQQSNNLARFPQHLSNISGAAGPLDPQLADALLLWRQQTRFRGPDDWIFASPAMRGQRPSYAGGHTS